MTGLYVALVIKFTIFALAGVVHMAYIVRTRKSRTGISKDSTSPVQSGRIEDARANWKRQAAASGLTFEELKGGKIVRTVDGDTLVTISWQEV